MFWITGGGALVIYLSKATGAGWLHTLAEQMEHVKWEGFHFFDLIFPLFMFISGVAIPYAILSKKEKGVSQSVLFKRILKRVVLLIIFGIIYNGGLKNGFENVRVASVLGQIGIAYFIAAVVFLYTKEWKFRVVWLFVIITLISVLQLAVPVPGHGAGVFDSTGSINAWLDQNFLPGRLHGKTFDPEGLLCIVSASVVTLLGAFAGGILRDGKEANVRKTLQLAVGGVVLIVIALAISPFYPIVKRMWTIPYDFLSAGISLLLLALFYYIVDVRKWQKWTLFFRVIGMNSITIYMATAMVSFYYTSNFLLGSVSMLIGDYGMVLKVIGVIAIEWSLLYYLYKNRIFLKV